jgi:Protein of unknown function (DUF1488)
MPLDTLAKPGRLAVDRDGVVFLMNDGERAVSVLVSRHALEDIAQPEQRGGRIDRFNEYRCRFEQIASAKYDRGLIEEDGTVCIRGRDLPGQGH